MKEDIIVAAGQYFVSDHPGKLVCIGLGSCIAITRHNKTRSIGSLAHGMLPQYVDGIDKQNPGKYIDTSIYLMVDELLEMGVNKRSLKAKIIGGAQMFSFINPELFDIGAQNIASAKQVLKSEDIPLIAEDTGGSKGRTISFDLLTGMIEIKLKGQVNKCI